MRNLVPELKILDKSLTLLAIVDSYSSFQGERRAWEVGNMELHIGLYDQGADQLIPGNLVMIDEKRVWEITSVTKREGDALLLTVTGRELKGFLEQRRIIPDAGNDEHTFGWDRVPDPNAPTYEPAYGEFHQDGVYQPGQARNMVVIHHGQDTTVKRPLGYFGIYWIGGMEPGDARNGDLWYGSYEGLQLMAGGYFQTVEDGPTGGYFLPDYNRYVEIEGLKAYDYTLYAIHDERKTVYDEITEDGYLIRRVGIMTLDGTENWANTGLPVGFFYSTSAVNETAAPSGVIACTRAIGYGTRPDADDKPPACFISENRNLLFNYTHIWDPEESLPDSVNTFKAELAAKANSSSPWVIYYELEFPEEIPLPHLGIPAEGIIKHYVNKHAADPEDPARKFPGLEIAPDQGHGPLTKWSARFKTLTETLKDIGEQTGVGYTVKADLATRTLVFDVIPVRDQTAGSNRPVILGVDFDNIQGLEYKLDTAQDITIAYAGGAGEDEDRLILTVPRTPAEGALTGFERKEGWLDCGSSQDLDDLLFEASYRLDQMERVETLTASFEPYATFKYMEDWDLGSLVTVRSQRLGLIQDKLITAVKETYESGKISIVPTLGKRNKTIIDEIRKSEVIR